VIQINLLWGDKIGTRCHGTDGQTDRYTASSTQRQVVHFMGWRVNPRNLITSGISNVFGTNAETKHRLFCYKKSCTYDCCHSARKL